MKKSKIMLLVASSALLVGCGGKTVSFQEAGKICAEILEKYEDDSFVAPTKVTITYSGEEYHSATQNFKEGLVTVIDVDNSYQYVKSTYSYVDGEEKGSSSYEFWIYKDGDKFIEAYSEVEGDETTKEMRYVDEATFKEDFDDIGEFNIEDIIDFGTSIAKAYSSFVDLTDEEVNEMLGDGEIKYAMTSSGSGNLVVEASYEGGTGSFEFKDSLLVSYAESEVDSETGEKESDSIKASWGKAKISKPNLKDFNEVTDVE